MGSDKREKPSGGLRRVHQAGVNSETADWGSCDAALLVNAIQKAAKKGGALRFGYTRDGGAYAVGVYAGGDYFTDYIRPSEDIDAYLREIAGAFEEYTPNESEPVKRRAQR